MRKRKRPASTIAPGEDLGIAWERWADGLPRRLKRKRDYPDVDVAAVRKDASAAAKRMGKAVVTTRDKYVPEKYVWVQFADHPVAPGKPCPCGGTRLLRLHANFLRCATCNAQLLITEEDEAEEARESRATQMLRELTDVHLELRGRTGRIGDLELYRGYAMLDDKPVLVWAEFRLKPKEERLPQKEMFDRVVFVRTVPFPELAELFNAEPMDVGALWDGKEPDWDLVWEGGEPDAPDPFMDEM